MTRPQRSPHRSHAGVRHRTRWGAALCVGALTIGVIAIGSTALPALAGTEPAPTASTSSPAPDETPQAAPTPEETTDVTPSPAPSASPDPTPTPSAPPTPSTAPDAESTSSPSPTPSASPTRTSPPTQTPAPTPRTSPSTTPAPTPPARRAPQAAPAPQAQTCAPDDDTACLTVTVRGLGDAGGWSASVQQQVSTDDGQTWDDQGSPISAANGDVVALAAPDDGERARVVVHPTATPADFDVDNDTCVHEFSGASALTCEFFYSPTSGRAPDATVRILAGGDRTAGDAVGDLPDGTRFQVATTAGDPPGNPFTCTSSGGVCTVTGLPTGFRWKVTPLEVPSGWHIVDSRGTGTDGATSTPYLFETIPELWGGDVFTVTTSGPYDSLAGGDAGYADRNQQSFSNRLAAVRDEPDAPLACGLRIGLVIDRSAAMTAHEQAMTTAVGTAVGALDGTDSQVSVYTFGSAAGSAALAPTPTQTAAGVQTITDFVDGLPAPADTRSNWDRGLQQVIADADDLDLVVMLTGGSPTVFAADARGLGDRTSIRAVDEAVFSANALKSAGVTVAGVGIGTAAAADANLQAISGPQDAHRTDDDTLSDVLTDVMAGTCRNALTIHKQIEDADGDIIAPTPTTANGWTFQNTISSGSITGEVTTAADETGRNGMATATITPGSEDEPTITVTEAGGPTGGNGSYVFSDATCTVGGTTVTPQISSNPTTLTFTGAIGQAMECTVVNKASTSLVNVHKIWHITDTTGATIAEYRLPDDAEDVPDGLSSSLSVDGAPAGWGVDVDGFAAGDAVTLDETSSVDTLLLPGCTLDASQMTAVDGQAPADGSLPFESTLGDGVNTFTITNTVTCDQQLSLVNEVASGTAPTDAWTLAASAPLGSSAMAGPTGSYTTQTPVTGPVSARTPYRLSASGGPATYVRDGDWVCRDDDDGTALALVAGEVTVPLGRAATCTVTNTTASLTVLVHLDQDTVHSPTWWQVTATPADGVDGLDPIVIQGADGDPADPPATSTVEIRPDHGYELTQALRSGYFVAYLPEGLQRWDGQEWVDASGPTVTLEPGEHAVYRFVNRPAPAITLPLTGGTGTALYLATGAGIAVIGVAAALWRRRMRRARP